MRNQKPVLSGYQEIKHFPDELLRVCSWCTHTQLELMFATVHLSLDDSASVIWISLLLFLMDKDDALFPVSTWKTSAES